MLAVTEGDSTIVIDCGGDVAQRLLAAGIGLDTIDGLIVTHEHPDHVAGFPLFIEKLWLAGRRRSLTIFGIPEAVRQARRCWEVFDTSEWKNVPDLIYVDVTHEERAEVFEDASFEVTASPGVHATPVVGLRVFSKRTGGVMAYSCDTEPCENIARLSNRADLLVHEANGKGRGHSSARQAAEIARDSGARRLILVHLPLEMSNGDMEVARRIFDRIEIGEDLTSYEF